MQDKAAAIIVAGGASRRRVEAGMAAHQHPEEHPHDEGGHEQYERDEQDSLRGA